MVSSVLKDRVGASHFCDLLVQYLRSRPTALAPCLDVRNRFSLIAIPAVPLVKNLL